MLHKVILPFDPNELAGIFALQQQLLQLACSVQQIDRQALEDHFDDDEIVNWIMHSKNRYERIIGSLNTFARECPTDEKQEIIKELENDYGFWEHREDPHFNFVFEATTRFREVIGAWLRGYFEQFGSGIDKVITTTRFVNKNVWVKAFREANPNLRTCPVCDGTMSGGITVEHFLPQCLFPVLSVHVANLIPICEHCNNPKGNNSPLENASLQEIFLPYHLHALDIGNIHIDRDNEGNYEFSFDSKEPPTDIAKSVQEFDALFRIPSRWNSRNGNRAIIDTALAKVQEQIDADMDDEIDNTDQEVFLQRIKVMCNRLEKNWGLQPYFVPATAWLDWTITNIPDELWSKYKKKIEYWT